MIRVSGILPKLSLSYYSMVSFKFVYDISEIDDFSTHPKNEEVVKR